MWSQKRKSRDNQENNPQPETDQITVTSWLPESVLNKLASDDNNQMHIQSEITEVSLELMQSLESTTETASFCEESEGLEEEYMD